MILKELCLFRLGFQIKNPFTKKGIRANKKGRGILGVHLFLIKISIQYNLQNLKLVKTIKHMTIYAFSISRKTSTSVGSEGIAPFFVAVIAPHALANLIASTSFF